MSKYVAVQEALAAWCDADRRLSEATNTRRVELEREVVLRRTEYHQLSGEHMTERIGALRNIERRRRAATPSTTAFHSAARDEQAIASEIWEAARSADEDIPGGTPRRN